MKRSFLATALIAGLAVQSQAIVGFGGHYLITPGAGVDAKTEILRENADTKTSVSLVNGKLEGMQGFGLKLWIDALPFVDIEGTGNFAFGSYSSGLQLKNEVAGIDTIIPIAAKMGYMGYETEAKPLAFASSGDLTVTYPFLKLPPAITILRLYAGAGVSYTMQSAILNKSLTEKAVGSALDSLANGDSQAAEELGKTVATGLADALAKEGLEFGVGGHVVVGARAKLPIIPIAAYANYKYYLGGYQSPLNYGQAIEIGGGIAF